MNADRRPSAAETAIKVKATTHTQSTDPAALASRREFAVRVFSVRADGVLVAQVFTDLKAAERKAARVRARGLDARLELVRLTPVQPLDEVQSVIA